MAGKGLSDRILETLLHELADGCRPPGQRMPSMRDLAGKYSVSPKTILGVIRRMAGQGLLEVHQRQPVVVRDGALKRAGELLAELSTSTKTRRLAVIIPEEFLPLSGNAFYNELATSLIRQAARHRMEATIVGIPVKGQIELADRVARRFDAAFVIGSQPACQFVLYALWSRRFPLAVFNRQIPGVDLPSLRQDDYGAARQIGEALQALGHRDLCLVASKLYPTADDDRGYVAGWLAFLKESGLMKTCSMPLVYRGPGAFGILLDRLLQNMPGITGLVLAYPRMLVSLTGHERLRELRIPERLSVAAMRPDADVLLPSYLPPLTWFELDMKRAAECAMEMIKTLLSGNLHPPNIRLPMRLRRTDSIGPAPPRPIPPRPVPPRPAPRFGGGRS